MDKRFIVTIGREFGTGGRQIATELAQMLGVQLYDKQLLEPIRCEDLQHAFREFRPYLGGCRFPDCRHLKEPDCAVRAALEAGRIAPERYHSYERLYEIAKSIPEWEKNRPDQK